MHYDVTVKVTEVNGESTADLHLCMASRTAVDPLVRPLVHWTVEQLKDVVRDRRLPVSGTKAELITRVGACYDTEFFESELEVEAFQEFISGNSVPKFDCLPVGMWTKEKLPLVQEGVVINYLKKKGGYTKNLRTGVRLCQCGHLYEIEVATVEEVVEADSHKEAVSYVRAKCRPTMRKNPSFYPLFVRVKDGTPLGSNYFCAAGATQSCVHVAALLLTLAEVSPTACTSMKCAWFRPSMAGKAVLSKELDFDKGIPVKGMFLTMVQNLLLKHFLKIYKLQDLNQVL